MATAADLRALEDECPWLRKDFQDDLAALRDSTAGAAQQFARDVRMLARLARQVPHCPMDERGATPWTSFRREVAVARSVSDVAAAAEIRAAMLLTSSCPRMMEVLEAGRTTVQRARVFVAEVELYDADLVVRLDEELSERVAGLPVWRIKQEVRRTVLVLDADAAAQRSAEKEAGRSVALLPDADDQATVVMTGPAVPLTRWYGTVDQQARALKQAGDPRTLDQLRFDLATSTYPCAVHPPADPGAAAAERGEATDNPHTASTDCRMSRPVQANISVPVETSLGLSNEPAWLDGYGWISAPRARLLLVDAELRRVCVRTGTGEVVDLDPHDVRPPPTPAGVRSALLDMVRADIEIHDASWRQEAQHDPSPLLHELVVLRDRFCDGPTGARVSARRADLDHDEPHPEGPTAAWNLVARGRRTHQLKHGGWTPLRTPTSTVWFSPCGQVVEIPRQLTPPPGIDRDPRLQIDALPDPDELAATDTWQLSPREDGVGNRPSLPQGERLDVEARVWLGDDADLPF